MSQIALITGITGQDGSYLAELLLNKGYDVHGIIRRASSPNTARLEHLVSSTPPNSLSLHYGDVTDTCSLRRILDEVRPDEVYNLAAQSHVGISFDVPVESFDMVAGGCVRLLESIRQFRDRTGQEVRFYQASSSEMFGKVQTMPQSESTPFYPRSPYGVAKLAAHWATVNHREAHGLHASNGILFNHESPRRGENFVTRKITHAVGRIKHGLQDKLFLGNLDAKRDWGFAGDYVEAMWLMLQQDEPDDYVIATGETHTVREFLEVSFGRADLDYQDYVEIDPRYYRPTEVDILIGDPRKAHETLRWEPKVGFTELAQMMVDFDVDLAGREKALADSESSPLPHNVPQHSVR